MGDVSNATRVARPAGRPCERLELLCDEGSLDVIRSFVLSTRIGDLAQPGDGVVAGLGRVNGGD